MHFSLLKGVYQGTQPLPPPPPPKKKGNKGTTGHPSSLSSFRGAVKTGRAGAPVGECTLFLGWVEGLGFRV